MERYLKMVVSGALLLSLSIVSVSKEASPFIAMEVKGVSVDSVGQTPVVILVDKEGKKAFPIWIGPQEALTVIGVTGTLNTSKNVAKGENNDHHD